MFKIPSRPIGQAQHYNGMYLMRAGEELVPMSPDQLKQIFSEGTPDFLALDASGMVDADAVVAALDTQTFFDLMGMPMPATREGILARLVSERLGVLSRGSTSSPTSVPYSWQRTCASSSR